MELVGAVRERDASYVAIIKARGEVNAIYGQLDKAQGQLEEIKKVACGSVFERVYNREIDLADNNYDKQLANLFPNVFQEGWLACLRELGIPLNILLGVRLPLQSSQWTPLKPILPLC